jgi:hypothetical protein
LVRPCCCCYPRLPIARIVGTDIAHAVPLALLAGLGHWLIGLIDGSLLVSLLIGAEPGIALDSFAATNVPEFVLRPGFCQGSRQNRPSEQYADKSGNCAVMISRAKPGSRN